MARDQAEQVDLDDPDFWKKAIGLVEQAIPDEKEDEVCWCWGVWRGWIRWVSRCLLRPRFGGVWWDRLVGV